MTIPGQTISVLDPGLGRVAVAPDSPLYFGPAAIHDGSAVAGDFLSFSRHNTIRSVLGYGQLGDDVAKALSERGGPVLAMITDASVADTISAVTASGGGPSVTVAGEANGRYTARIEIVAAGALGVGTFRYTLDRHSVTSGSASPTWSPVRTIPGGGTFVMGNSGITATFPAGSYVAGETYDFTAIPAAPNATDLGTAATELLAMTGVEFPLAFLAATFDDAGDAATIAAAMASHMTSFATGNRFARCGVDAGSGDSAANVLAEAANWSSRRILPCYGFSLTSAILPYEGHATRKVGCLSDVAARAARVLISTDLARYAEGPLTGVTAIDFDGNGDQTLDAAGITTLRTFPGSEGGFRITNGRLKSPAGSDFTDLQFGRCMDRACRTVFRAQLPFIAEGFRTTSTGAIDPLDKADIEAAVRGALVDELLAPRNARGRSGHVSAVSYTVDPDHDLNGTDTILVNVGIRPLGYSKFIVSQIGFALNV